jgi:hypothetical protein
MYIGKMVFILNTIIKRLHMTDLSGTPLQAQAVAVVTGSTRGLVLAIAQELARSGYAVVVASRLERTMMRPAGTVARSWIKTLSRNFTFSFSEKDNYNLQIG